MDSDEDEEWLQSVADEEEANLKFEAVARARQEEEAETSRNLKRARAARHEQVDSPFRFPLWISYLLVL